MTQLISKWWDGMELLLRLVIMLFCTLAGPVLLLVAQFTLVSLGVRVPAPAVVLTQLISVVIVGPLLLTGYADYCGYRSGTSRPESSN